MAKAVVFDMGGVILRLDIHRCIETFKTVVGFQDIDNYLDPFHQKGFIGDFEAGRIGVDEFYAACIAHSQPGTTLEEVKYCFNSLLDGYNSDVIELVTELHSMGCDLYILSNNNPLSVKALSEELENHGIFLELTFRKLFFSYQMKLLKPGREIYERMIREIGREPSDILFIDDSKVNIAAGEAAGLATILYSEDIDIRKAVMELL